MRIAVVGSGVAGLASAWLLSREHEVVLFESNDYLGGHTDTHQITLSEGQFAVDTGFIVYNDLNYPLLTRMFAELGVQSQSTRMSFAVKNERSGLEYNATNIDGLFCQRRNLFSPRFIGMLRDLFRFYRNAGALLDEPGAGPTLGEYLEQNDYSQAFRDDHLVPMASALWSSPSAQILGFPARYLIRFMANHRMLQASARPQWKVVKGGSRSYVEAMRKNWQVETRLNCPVSKVSRDGQGVQIDFRGGSERFDQTVLACHSDQALALLSDASGREREILGAMKYQRNDTVLHTDVTLLPRRRKAWAAWNALIDGRDDTCSVSYCMNILQSLPCKEPLIVTLNRTERIAPEKILRRLQYHHPVYSHASVSAQQRRDEIQGRNRTWFAGAYWGWGFHEDGMRSAVDVARSLGVRWP